MLRYNYRITIVNINKSSDVVYNKYHSRIVLSFIILILGDYFSIYKFSGLPHWFAFYVSGTIKETDGQLYIHFKNHQRVYVIGTGILL